MDSDIDGYLNMLKPPGMTSHDVVSRVRRCAGTRHVGHAGTLDPAAAGVLPVALGRATRTLSSPVWDEKEYWADITFGTSTTTDDAEGDVMASGDPSPLDVARLQAALSGFVGVIWQRPPAYSAVHVAGQRAYRAARAGATVDLPARQVHIEALALVRWCSPVASLRIRCHSGVYVRALARDLGELVGCPAHLSGLVRTRMGAFSIADGLTPAALAAVSESGGLQSVLWSRDVACVHLPAVVLPVAGMAALADGRWWPAMQRTLADQAHTVRAYAADGSAVGLTRRLGAGWTPVRGLRPPAHSEMDGVPESPETFAHFEEEA